MNFLLNLLEVCGCLVEALLGLITVICLLTLLWILI